MIRKHWPRGFTLTQRRYRELYSWYWFQHRDEFWDAVFEGLYRRWLRRK